MIREKIKKKYENIMDRVCTFISLFVTISLVWCLTPNTTAFVFALISISLGLTLYIALTYILSMNWKRIKAKLKVSERYENKNMTNGDRIRNMTNEELAIFLLTEECKVCLHCQYNGEYGCEGEIVCGTYHLEDVWKKWLASEYEEKK